MKLECRIVVAAWLDGSPARMAVLTKDGVTVAREIGDNDAEALGKALLKVVPQPTSGKPGEGTVTYALDI